MKMYTQLLLHFIFGGSLFLVGCGKADFSGHSDPSPVVTVPILLTGSDTYAEIGQQFSNTLTGQVDLTNVDVLGQTIWPGLSTLQFELRVGLTGSAAPSAISVTGSQKPSGWDSGTVVFNQTVAGGSALTALQSANLKDALTAAIQQGVFWIDIRVKYLGVDTPKNLTLQNFQAFADGQKNLNALAPLINLTF